MKLKQGFQSGGHYHLPSTIHVIPTVWNIHQCLLDVFSDPLICPGWIDKDLAN